MVDKFYIISKKLLFTFFFFTLIFAQEEYKIEAELLTFDELMKIMVTTASKKAESVNDAPGIVQVISRQEIDGFAANNLGEVLNRVTGSVFLSANVFTSNLISLRGQTITPYNNHILILINGRPIRDPITGGLNNVMFTSFPLAVVKHIEVIRGPGSVLYGSCAYSGVINVVTQSLNENGQTITLEAEGGSFGAFGQTASGVIKTDNIDLTFGLKHFDDEGPEYSFTDYLGVNSKANFAHTVWSGFMNLKISNLTVNGFYGNYEPLSLLGSDNNWDLGDNPYDNNIHKHYFLDVGYSSKLSDQITIESNVTYNRRAWSVDLSGTRTAYSLAPEVLVKYTLDEEGTLLFGASYNFSKYWGTRLISNDIMNITIFSQFDYKIFPKTKLIAGLQLNKIEDIAWNLSPRFGIIHNFNDEIGIKFLFSTAYRKGYPMETSFDSPVFRGNLELKPELIDTYEFQTFYSSEKIRSSLTLYYSRMSQMIFRKLVIDPEIPPAGFYLIHINKGSHKFYGVEFETKLTLADNLIGIGSYAYQTNENEEGIENATLHPNNYLKLGLLYQDAVYSVGLFNSYFGEPTQVSVLNPDVNEVNVKPESFNLLSVKISVEILGMINQKSDKKLYFSIEGDNILDEDIRYPEYTSRGVNSLLPLRGGVSFTAGIKYKF